LDNPYRGTIRHDIETVELQFATPALRSLAESASGCAQLLHQKDGALLCQRLCELAAAESLAAVSTLPALDFQRHGSEGKCSVRVTDGHRLAMVAVNMKSNDLQQITTVRIIAIERA
jgi:hypothetical protein